MRNFHIATPRHVLENAAPNPYGIGCQCKYCDQTFGTIADAMRTPCPKSPKEETDEKLS